MAKRKVTRRPAQKVNFTENAIEGLPLPEPGKSVYYYDSREPGLAVRITGRGTRTFILYRKILGRPERITLGRYPRDLTVEAARKKASALSGKIATDENPQDAIREARAELTLGQFYEKYLEQHLKLRGKRIKNPESYYKLYLSPWRRRKMSGIKRTDVQALHAEIAVDKGGVTANRVYQLLRAMYNRANYWGDYAGENPAAGIDRYPEKSRKRFLQPDEMPRFFAALAESDETLRDFVLLALLTGARRSNVQSMRWDQLHLGRATWDIPVTKTGDSHIVPLVSEAVAVLQHRQDRSDSEWVFPSRGKSGHLVEPKKAWKDLLERAGIEDLWIHDLRRTLGSWQAASGASLTTIGEMLGHKNVSTTAIYARLNLDPVRQSVNAATRAMLVAGKVVEGEVEELEQ